MLNLPKEIIILDFEWTAWEGSARRWWTGPEENRELVQMAAIAVETQSNFAEQSVFQAFLKPRLNPTLPEYFIDLTGISQEKIDREGIDFPEALRKFQLWCPPLRIYSWTETDFEVLVENCKIWGIQLPPDLQRLRFSDMRSVFWKAAIPAEDFSSGNIILAFNKEPARQAHNALNDIRTMIDGLSELSKRHLGSNY